MKEKTTLGFAITGSFCTHDEILKAMENLKTQGYELVPIFSYNVATQDTRFGNAQDFYAKVKLLTGLNPVCSLQDAEKLGPNSTIDVMVVAPCTGNTVAKIANSITDTPVTMAVKAHLRNNKPVVIGISTNDALGLNLKNIGVLMATKNVYFVPYGQDNFEKKPNSLISDWQQIANTVECAKQGKQLQPVILKN